MTASSRREFLLSTSAMLGSAWLSAHCTDIESARNAAQRAFKSGETFQNLTPAEAGTLAAFAEQIVPTDDLPGATDAGAIYFIDAALTGFAAFAKPLVQSGAAALDAAASQRNRRVSSFAELSSAQQVRVMKSLESQDFFGVLRTLSIMGVFADPKYGGNRDAAGFRIVDLQHATVYASPFGHYDAQAQQASKARRP